MHAVQVMADETDTHTEAVVERFAEIGNAIAVRVAQQPEIRNVRVPDVSFARQNAGADTVERRVKTIGEDRRMIGLAVTVARSEEHTSELQSQSNLVCRLLLEKKKTA